MKYNFSSRIRFIYGVIIFISLILIGQLYSMQVVHGDSYRQEAESQYTSSGDVFDRGSIYFTEKDGTPFGAAILQTGYILAINPEHIQNPEVVYDQLSKIIPIDKTAFLKSAEKQNDPYEKITDHIKDTDAEKISKLKIPGVGLYPEKWRFYPGGDTASHILGFVGYQGNTLAGRYGLEQEYNNVLSESGPGIDMNLFAEVFAGNSGTSSPQEGTRKGDVYTTIEPTVENFLENTLKQAKEKWNAETVGGIIMNPKTGEIYAMTALPQFDPNNYASADISTFKDPLVGNVFEMGSVFKALTMAAALDAGAVTPNTMYDDKGSVIINGARVSNWDFKARGWINMQTVLDQSLNLGAVFAMEQMGQDTFSNYMRKYQLDQKTGIDLPGEVNGNLLNLNSPREIEHATASFGQGIAVTPVELVRALSSLGNGGTLPYPHVVREIDYTSGPPWVYQQKSQPRVLKQSTSEEITRMLVGVFDDAVMPGKDSLDHYSIATKTGTAQIAMPNGGGYYPNRYLNTWFGYFPAYNPQFLVFLYLKHPQGAMYASQTLKDPFVDTAKFLINYYNIPPDR